MTEDPQLANPLKRPLVLMIYETVKLLYPQAVVKYAEHYERELNDHR